MKRGFRYAARLNAFKSRSDLYPTVLNTSAMIKRASSVKGLDCIEPNFPDHFCDITPEQMRVAAENNHLSISGVNVRFDPVDFRDGAFTNPNPAKREQARAYVERAVHTACLLDTDQITLWIGPDGFDYPFQFDYARAWEWVVDGLGTLAQRYPHIRISVEYKAFEPRCHTLLRDVGTTLLALSECHAHNLGVTLDFAHMLIIREHPAFAAALCLRQQRLFGIHLNDSYGQTDDGLMVASVHMPQTLELLAHLLLADFDGVVYFDTFPVREDPVAECTQNIHMCDQLIAAIQGMDRNVLSYASQMQDGVVAMRLVTSLMAQTSLLDSKGVAKPGISAENRAAHQNLSRCSSTFSTSRAAHTPRFNPILETESSSDNDRPVD